VVSNLSTEGLALKLTEVLHREVPGLLRADLEDSARAAVEVANLLGCILANVLGQCGEPTYLEACKIAMRRMDKTAREVTNMAGASTTRQ
jgi:hypothetical protein